MTHPLTFPQQAIYLDALLRPSTTKFNMGGGIVIRGPLDTELFRQGLEGALGAHDAQRIRIYPDGETAMQEFVPEQECTPAFEMRDVSQRPKPLRSAIDWLLADIGRPMRVDQFPLYGDFLFRLAGDLHLWYPKFHHIAYDAFGHSLIAATAAQGYNELLRCGRLPSLERRTYAAFIEDDRAYSTSAQFRNDEAFWRQKFPAMPQPLPFTARKGELTGDVLRTERCELALNRLVYDSVARRADEAGITPFQLLLACLYAYLSRTSGCDDIVIGTPILNRSNHAFRRTAGMFMNMMPLRIRIEPDATVFGLAERIKAETRSCYRHQRFPLSETLRHCRSVDGFCHGVFDVTVVYRKLNYDITFGGSPIRVITLDTGAREETLSLEIDEYNDDEDVNLFFNFNPQLIPAEEAHAMARAFEMLLMDIAIEGDRRVREIRISPAPSITASPQPAKRKQNVVERFEQQAAAAPDAVAVISGEDRPTRGDLQLASTRIAAFLANSSAALPEQPVAVLSDRNTQWITALLGILKAGCAYLPLDPQMPRERLRYILRDSGCRLLLAGSGYEAEEFENVRSIPVAEAAQYPEPAIQPARLTPHSLAYIIYTSGTTGLPKGVLIEHGSLANTIGELLAGWEVSAADRVLEFAAPMFDASIVDIFLALASGAPLVIAPKDVILNPERFLNLLRRRQVTVATLPPAYLSALSAVDLAPLRLLITAGEAANPADVARYAQHLTYVNAYGPTECSVCASYFKLAPGTEFTATRVPIGNAIGSTRIQILDENLHPLPLGAIGELCVSGAGLARGYQNQPELNAERFPMNPADDCERLYRTGDLGRLLPGGNIEFIGRRDTQVKIRGYRVELGEIETALKTHPSVETAAVTLLDSTGELIAYIVARSGFDARKLRRFLSSKLPAYMVPSRYMQIAAMPLNSSGKVDRDALPDPSSACKLEPHSSPPQTPLEAAVAGIWEEVLDITNVGADQDFFEIGGHSLKAVRVLSRIQQRLGRSIEMADFFANPTVAALASAIERAARSEQAPIPPAAPMESYPLSNAQGRIWVLAQMEGGSAAYNMPVALDLRGTLDPDALEEALRAVITRHESLRTCFVTEGDVPQQKILAAAKVSFDLGRERVTEGAARTRIQQEFERPFDLRNAPLLRATVFQIEEHRWLLCLVVHHLVADGWSLDVLLKELSILYAGPTPESAPQLPALLIQYRDYSQWIAAHLDQDGLSAARDYWRQTLAGPLPVLNLPTDYARPATLEFQGAVERIPLAETANLDLERFCADRRVSPFMVLLASVFALLHRYSGDEDIIIGTPVANRDRMELENQIGLYLNTLALRVRLDGQIALSTLLDRVRAAVIAAQQHQSFPFDSLVAELEVKRASDRNPLFDVMVIVEDAVTPEFRAPGVHGQQYSVPFSASVFDLTFHFSRTGHSMCFDLEYNTGLFGHARAHRLATHLDRVIAAIVRTPDAQLGDIDILPNQERQRILEEFSNGPTMPPPAETVIDRFARQAARNPDRTAVVFNQRRLSYRDLSEASASLVNRIREAGIAPGSVLALIANRSEWIAAGVIGIMASGAICLPIDPAQPNERIERILNDSECRAVVSDSIVHSERGRPIVPLRKHAPASTPLLSSAHLTDAAYIAYTSGSTGTPKGSLIGHRSLANLVSALGPVLYDPLPEAATELLLTSIGFDVAMKQIFGALTRGNTLWIASEEQRHDPSALMASIAEGGIHLIDITPAHFAALLAQGFTRMPKPSLASIVLGSESLPCGLVEEFVQHEANRHIALFNFYGPSECTVETMYCRLDGRALPQTRVAPIGRPIANTRAYVLSAGNNLAPIGIPGEICLGGVALGRGYLNQPELTSSRFIDDPFHPGERIYRTGDLGRWNANGDLEFLGRLDRQLKIRGHRIEPGEIEHHLLRHSHVSQAVVETRPSSDGSNELIAYVAQSAAVDARQLRAFLKPTLPAYMMPAAFVILPDLPLLPSGKIDRNALPETETPAVNQQYTPPRDATEEQLLDIWESLLAARPIGIHDEFFDVGGHSLLGVRLIAEIDRRCGRRLPLSRLFEAPTIAALAALLRTDASPAPSCLVRIGAAGSRYRLFFVPGATGTVSYLHPLAQQLGSDTSFYAFQAQGLEGSSAPHQTLDAMAAHYAALLLEAQPHGPYLLAGHSFGGIVAFAIAQILVERGQEIALLAVVDGHAPNAFASLAAEPVADDAQLMRDLGRLTVQLPDGGEPDHLRRLLNVYRSHLQMRPCLPPESSRPVPISLFRAAALLPDTPLDPSLGEHLGWAAYSNRRVSVNYVPGNHMTMMSQPHVVSLAESIAQAMNDALEHSSASTSRQLLDLHGACAPASPATRLVR
jgi:amino acid adenylation domain-containing protein